MKRIVCVALLGLLGLQLAMADAYISPSSYDYKPQAKKITANARTDMQKLRAIYDWMCENIQYDTSYKIATADECYKKRKGVCQAYSELMYRLCEAVGVKCTIVSGTARHFLGGGGHAWICAHVEGRNVLIDPTWGAGSVNGTKFTFRDDHSYWFDVDPYWMIFTHFPKNEAYQFLARPISYERFEKLPRLDPNCKYFGWDAKDIFLKCINGTITSWPELYNQEEQYLQLTEIPFQEELKVGRTYRFKVKAQNPRNIAIINNSTWYTYELWRYDGQYSIIDITPREKGKLSISYERKDGMYDTIVEYKVVR
jgi:hypothetical protein